MRRSSISLRAAAAADRSAYRIYSVSCCGSSCCPLLLPLPPSLFPSQHPTLLSFLPPCQVHCLSSLICSAFLFQQQQQQLPLANYANVSNYAFRTLVHTLARTHTLVATRANMSSETKSIWFINLPYDKIINYCHAFKLLRCHFAHPLPTPLPYLPPSLPSARCAFV